MPLITSCSQFTQFLVDQQPNYDRYIIKDIRPGDSANWIPHVKSGTFEAWSGTQHTRDRFNNVYPNVTKTWLPVNAAGCLGTPCDLTEYQITWGSTRLTYGLEQQSWQTDLLCFDQEMHITHAREQFGYIISKILRPATTFVQSNFLRKRVAQFADNKFIANSGFATAAANFVYSWVLVSDEERFIDTNAPPTSVFKLTPQMLQRMVEPLISVGYMGENPFTDKRPPMLELVVDTQVLWELDKLGGQQSIGGIPSVTGNWRFTNWDAANKYWKYGFSGQLGNYTVRVDPNNLRFNYIGFTGSNHRYQVVLPYKNVPSSGAGSQAGLKSIRNPDFDAAQFCFSYIHHPMGVECLVSEAQPVNSEMPFASRNFAGRWQFVMDNLGADQNGCVIQNKRRNKGQFIADFKQAIAPNYTEFLCLIFHKREPACVIQIDNCSQLNLSYPAQTYNSASTPCAPTGSGTSPIPNPTVIQFTLPTLPTTPNGLTTFQIEANSAICEGSPLQHGFINAPTAQALVTALSTVSGLEVAGTWSVVNATTIQLSGPCTTFVLPFIV